MVHETVSKDLEATLVFDNTEFQLSSRKALTTGNFVGLRLFDGQKWRIFDPFVVVDPARDYVEGGTITLKCRSLAVTLQFREAAQRWENVTDAEVVQSLAQSNGYKAVIGDPLAAPVTSESSEFSTGFSAGLSATLGISSGGTEMRGGFEVRKETAMAQESASEFLNKLAERNGFEWYIKGKTIYFKKPDGLDNGLVLVYRPGQGKFGTVIQAKVSRHTQSKSGKNNKPNVPLVDFKGGTVDPATAAQGGPGTEGGNAPGAPVNRGGAGSTGPTDAPAPRYKLDKDTMSVTLTEKTQEIQHPKQAETPVEAAVLAAGLGEANAYEWQLEVETYGMSDITIRQIFSMQGLSAFDDGKWLLTDLTTNYTAGAAYRLNITGKAASRLEGGSAGMGAPMEVKVVQNKREEQTVDGPYVLQQHELAVTRTTQTTGTQ